MHNGKYCLILAVCCVVVIGTTAARYRAEFNRVIDADPAVREIILTADIDAGSMDVMVHDGVPMVEIAVVYHLRKVEIDVEYEAAGDVGEVFLNASRLSRFGDIDSRDCRWEVSLSTDYTWDMQLDIGAGDFRYDLSGLPLENFELDMGAGNFELFFRNENPVELRSLDIDAGAGELRVIGLGYSNFTMLNLDGGAGEFVLNFDGLTDGFHEASLDVGIGELRLELPESLPVSIVASDGWFQSIELDHADIRKYRGRYESRDFDRASYGLKIDLDVGMGEAVIASSR